MTKHRDIFDICDQLEAIEARPLPRAERDALQAPLLVQLREARLAQDQKARITRELVREVLKPR